MITATKSKETRAANKNPEDLVNPYLGWKHKLTHQAKVGIKPCTIVFTAPVTFCCGDQSLLPFYNFIIVRMYKVYFHLLFGFKGSTHH